jgi:hypothetical protein
MSHIPGDNPETPPSEALAGQEWKDLVGFGKGTPSRPVCVGCGRAPNEIPEYLMMSHAENDDPIEWMKANEGTYNPRRHSFACTDCYIKMGMPAHPYGRRWVAP